MSDVRLVWVRTWWRIRFSELQWATPGVLVMGRILEGTLEATVQIGYTVWNVAFCFHATPCHFSPSPR